MTTIHVAASREYDIEIGRGLLDQAGAHIARVTGAGRTAAVISDDGDHVVVDVDLNGSAPVGDATEQADMKNSQGESVSDAEPDEALKEFEALMTANDIIIRSAFYYILLPSLFAMALPLLLYELLELHDRRRL